MFGWILNKLHDRTCPCKFQDYAATWDELDQRREPHAPDDMPGWFTPGGGWAAPCDCSDGSCGAHT